MNTFKKLLVLVLLNLLGGASFFVIGVGFFYCVSRRIWEGVLLCLVMLVITRQILLAIEKRVGIYSKTSILGRRYGAGITFYAPWVRAKTNKPQVDDKRRQTAIIHKITNKK